MTRKHYYGKGLPRINATNLTGKLIVLEGGDGSGRSTQMLLLRDWLRRLGYPTTEIGLKRSALVGPELMEAMRGNTLGPITLSLFYATDFADQLEHSIIPSLRAGFIVLADRYIYTLMARDIARGANLRWIQEVYGMALVPDTVLYLKVSPKILAERSFQKSGVLDYWESGMDIQRSGDMYDCFTRYQRRIQKTFSVLSNEYGFQVVDGERDPFTVHNDIRTRLAKTFEAKRSRRTASQTVLKQPSVEEPSQ